jgi:hypothetical protein
MPVIEWDKVGERFYQTGIDRGVLYLKDGTAVPWNGLISIEDNSDYDQTPYYLDGIKILNHVTPGNFVGKLSAFTYPKELDEVSGIVEVAEGLKYYEQPYKTFTLCYRTKIGSDVNADEGYEIHLLYNLTAGPDVKSFQTIDDNAEPTQFNWTLTGVPQIITGHRPTVHISMNSIDTDPDVFAAVEDILYGTDIAIPRVPTVSEIKAFYGAYGALLITDNGDGTWSAVDEADDYITMLDATTFQIQNANAVYLDANTYEISDTNL